jgi:hypothetical protein
MGDTCYIDDKANPDFSDLRFISYEDNTTEFDYWCESVDRDTSATFWVNIPEDLSSSAVSFWIYYGNDGANSLSNPTETFYRFVNFSLFTIRPMSSGQSQGNYQIINHTTLRLYYNEGRYISYKTKIESGYSQILEFDMKTTDTGEVQGIGFSQSTGPDYYNTYKFAGYQHWGIPADTTYSGSGDWESMHTVITLYQGNRQYWHFIDDNDYYDSSDLYIRNVRLRKYTFPEPTHGLWDNEESSNSGPGINWQLWINPSQNPDESPPWSFLFDFGENNGNGYYEFYSIGQNNGNVEEKVAEAEAICRKI